MSCMIIRSEEQQEAGAVRDLIRLAFGEAAHSSGTEPAIVDALRNAGALRISLVAVEGAAIVGHVAVSPVTTEDGSGGWFGLGPVSVRPDRQCEGIGSALITEALQRLRSSPEADGCLVLGEPSYYGRFGFKHDPEVSYGDVPPPYFQVLPFGARRPRGAIEFHRAFNAAY